MEELNILDARMHGFLEEVRMIEEARRTREAIENL